MLPFYWIPFVSLVVGPRLKDIVNLLFLFGHYYTYIYHNYPFIVFDMNNNPNFFDYCFSMNFSNIIVLRIWGSRTLVCNLLLFEAIGKVRSRKTASATQVLDTSSCWALRHIQKVTSHLISFIFKLRSASWSCSSTYIFNLTEKVWPFGFSCMHISYTNRGTGVGSCVRTKGPWSWGLSLCLLSLNCSKSSMFAQSYYNKNKVY